MRTAIDSLKGIEAICLDATLAGQAVYQRLNFAGEVSLSRWVGFFATTVPADEISSYEPLQANDLSTVGQLDARAFGVDRSALLKRLFEFNPDLAWLARSARDGSIRGFCMARDGVNFCHIGPLVAADTATAIGLIRSVATARPGKKIGLDAFDLRRDFSQSLSELGLVVERSFIRMHLGSTTPQFNESYYASAGPEFG
jgi:hypothetical protein